jgi:hypothetical protein
MVDFKKLRERSGKKALEKLQTELEKVSGKQFTPEENLWQPTVDKAGNGYAVIRFLPAHDDDDDTAFIKLWDYGFQGPSGSWYFENSLTTIGKPDPVAEFNNRLWNSGVEADKELARKYKRRLHFKARIHVVTDNGNPENEGKEFYYKFGKKLFAKLAEAMNPEFEDEQPMNPFDLWEGANFKIKVRNVEGYRNYDKSEFGTPGPLSDDETMHEIMQRADKLPLKKFIAPDQFKTYEELKAKFEKVMGTPVAPVTRQAAQIVNDEEDVIEPVQQKSVMSVIKASVAEDDDDEMSNFFASLKDD